MTALDDREKAEYFQRCYLAADGLWFLKCEERYGFKAALDLDDEVWKALPKIQIKALKALMDLQSGIDALRKALEAKLEIEGFSFHIDSDSKGLTVQISRCPWHDLMVHSGRKALSGAVGGRICQTENRVWADKFGPGIEFFTEGCICKGDSACTLRFLKKGEKRDLDAT